MPTIATLTINPTIDVAYEVDRIAPTQKLRSHGERYDPGGGGINVARVFVRLGGNAVCHYLSGGATGDALDGLLDLHQLVRRPVRIAGATRIASNVFERDSGMEYRFIPNGPQVSDGEWQACLDSIASAKCDYLVASGSLPAGVPDDFYARVAAIAEERGLKLVLDTSGKALREGLSGARIHLAKPNLAELEELVGRALGSPDAVAGAAMELVTGGKAELVAVTMGSDGGVLASADGPRRLPAIEVVAKSAVGAGDSFLAGMVYALAIGREPLDAFYYGMAAGSAAVLTPGTDLARRDDVLRLYSEELRGKA